MQLKQTLSQVKSETDRYLIDFFRQKKEEAGKIDGFCPEIVNRIEDLTMRGGKRTRPFLVWCGYSAYASSVNSTINRPLLNLMTAVELFQSFALIQDDIMDEDEERRGGMTVHKSFERSSPAFVETSAGKQSTALPAQAGTSHQKDQKKKRLYGESMGMLAGDMAMVWADELFYKCLLNPPPGKPSAALREDLINVYQQMKEEILYGQALDVANTHRIISVQREKINEMKTAWYSVIRPLQLGAALAGAGMKNIEELVGYGLPVGLAFQAKDDEIDGEITKVELDKKGKKYINNARAVLNKLNIKKEYKDLLSDFGEFVINRER